MSIWEGLLSKHQIPEDFATAEKSTASSVVAFKDKQIIILSKKKKKTSVMIL